MFRGGHEPKLTVRALPTTKTNGFRAGHSGLINETKKNGAVRACRARPLVRDHI